MPRVTRAALRSNMILEDEANLAAETPLPTTPGQERTPLGEVTGNLFQEVIQLGEDLVAAGKPMKKTRTAQGKKTKGAKGTRQGRKKNETQQENRPEVLEDDDESSTSSAVEEACRELMRESTGGRASSYSGA